MASTRDTELLSLLASLRNNTITGEAIGLRLSAMNVTVMNSEELELMMWSMSKSQIVSILKSLLTGHNTNAGAQMMRVVWVLLSFTTVVLIARLLVKWKSAHRFFYDDICMLTALMFGYLHAIFITISYGHGFGRHMIFLTSVQRQRCIHAGFISIAWGILSPMFGRVGFLWSLLFISGVDPKVKKWTIWSFIGLQIGVNAGAIIVLYAQCGSHLLTIWSPNIWANYQKYCWDPSVQSDYGYFAGSFNTLTDLFLTAVPGVMIMHSSVPSRQKIVLAFLLCLSILAMVAAIVKTYESKALAEIADYTYDLVPYTIWVSIELNIVITVASIPILRPLFKGLKNRIRGSLAKHGNVHDVFENISLGSMQSRKQPRVTNMATSSSQEHIAPQQDPFTITHTVEVSITTGPNKDITLVHAALVGLVADDAKVASIWH